MRSADGAGKKVVLDTNVIVAAALSPKGIPAAIFEAAVTGRIVPYASTKIIEELDEVLTVLLPETKDILLRTYLERVIVLEPPPFTGCRDPDDDKFVAVALFTGATIITGDEDLLSMDIVPVSTPRAFLHTMHKRS